ncbi:CDP-alcohol phosphatidyltransferase family protein [Vulcanisaeta thermophila]|uniref:CDP-alcohol phosphatidyltransferase family protein n=1 Tax=Vulcanisaeta thermophila TaxID=867917 RepID=UPI00085351D9|nr:CDP-alcohol phosphatidyltransferase family protein [Vulcanisaeta thermophila]
MLTVVLGRLKDEIERIGKAILKRGLIKVLPHNPNLITILSLVLALPTPVIIYMGIPHALVITLVLLIVAGFFDMVDGLVARYLGRTTVLGAFLDSTLDRYVDFITLIDLWLVHGGFVPTVLLLLSILGSLMTSYTRARAEALGLKMLGVGLLEREERLLIIYVIIIAYLMLHTPLVITYGLGVLAVLTNATAVQRIVIVTLKVG